MSESRKQFTFYSSFYEAVSKIKKKADRADAYDAICAYAIDGKEPDFEKISDTAALAFVLIKPNLDASKRKAEGGKKGGETASKTEANGKQSESIPQAYGKDTASIPQARGNRKRGETASEKEKEGEKEKEKEKEKENECYIFKTSPNGDVCPTATVERIVNAWNELSVFGIPAVSAIRSGTKRHDMLRKRLADYGADEVVRAIGNIKTSDFLKGGKGFTVTFDWFIKPNNFVKVLEGNYNDKAKEDKPDEQQQRYGVYC